MGVELTLIGCTGLFSMPVMGSVLAGTTGFQSPADDYLEDRIDLAKELVTTKANTFCWRVSGSSFEKVGIKDGAIVVIDYSRSPKANDIVLAKLGDVVTLKIIKMVRGRPCLISASDGYPIVPINEEEGVQVFGVLKHCVLSF